MNFIKSAVLKQRRWNWSVKCKLQCFSWNEYNKKAYGKRKNWFDDKTGALKGNSNVLVEIEEEGIEQDDDVMMLMTKKKIKKTARGSRRKRICLNVIFPKMFPVVETNPTFL